jgi:TetR/AcrR family fatty acid metabolism transcriptional regulator
MRKKEGDKENDIINAAIDVFAERGFHDTKIHTIADQAGIATGTVYLYFGNKENILLRIFEKVWAEIFQNLEKISQCVSLEPLEKYNMLIDSLFDYFFQNPSLASLYVNEQNYLTNKKPEQFTSFYKKTINIIETYLNEGIKEGLFNPETNIKITSVFFLGGLRLLLHEWAQSQDGYDSESLKRSVKEMIFIGLTGNQFIIKESR